MVNSSHGPVPWIDLAPAEDHAHESRGVLGIIYSYLALHGLPLFAT